MTTQCCRGPLAAILLLILAVKERGRIADPFRAMGRGGILLACVLTASSIAYLFLGRSVYCHWMILLLYVVILFEAALRLRS